MQSILYVIAALALIAAGFAFVPDYTEQRAEAAWGPVVQQIELVDPIEGSYIELDARGDYIVFLEGPVQDPIWKSANLEGTWVDVLETQSSKTLRSRTDVEYAFESNGRRAQALAEVFVSRPDQYSLHISGPDLEARGFKLALHPTDPVDDSNAAAAVWRFAKWAAAAFIAICSLSFLAKAKG